MLFTIQLLSRRTQLNTVISFAIYNLLNLNLNVFLFWVGPVDRRRVNEQAKNIIMKCYLHSHNSVLLMETGASDKEIPPV